VFWGVEYALLTGRWMVGKSFRFPWKPVGKSKPTSSSDTTDAARHAHESELPRHGAR
jgi:hypothetical protein